MEGFLPWVSVKLKNDRANGPRKVLDRCGWHHRSREESRQPEDPVALYSERERI